MRYMVVMSSGGLIQGGELFSSLSHAKKVAKKISEDLDPESDDIVVLDLNIDHNSEQRVYQPLQD